MDREKWLSLLENISFALLDFKEGDLLYISSLIDRVKELQALLLDCKPAVKVLAGVSHALEGIMKQGDPSLKDVVIEGIDLVGRIIKSIPEQGKKGSRGRVKNVPDEIWENEIGAFEKQSPPGAAESGDVAPVQKKSRKEEAEIRLESESFKIFLSEAYGKLTTAQDLILKLEEDAHNLDLVHEIFRIFHTIKGECGFLRLVSLGELAHNIENLLDLLRMKEMEVDSSIIDLLLKGIDYTKKLLDALSKGNVSIYNLDDLDEFMAEINMQTSKSKTPIGKILENQGKLSETHVLKILQKQKEMGFSKKFGEIAVEKSLLTEDELKESLDNQELKKPESRPDFTLNDPIIKVKSSQINYLVDMIGELIIAENQIESATQHITQLKKITREIQFAALKLRTTKIESLFLNMKRVVRDLAKKLSKKIQVKLIGEQLEIDRNLVEMLEEPLVHLLRNAVHHGIEPPGLRVKKGKPAEATVTMRSERRGNSIIISIEDDGGGLDREKIIAAAIAKGLLDPAKAEAMPDNEVYNIIFLQGFSTADDVGLVSGRGVGMDIVKSVVTSHRGKLQLETEKDKYTRVKMIFPLSTAVIDGMIVNCEGIPMIIPVSNIIESLKIKENMLHKVENEVSVIDLRGEIIPVITANEFFGINGKDKEKDELLSIIVENELHKKYAFIVDEIIAKKEVVMKPLGGKFKNLKGISSGTILQGGKVGFVLDVEQIVAFSSNNKL